MGGRPEPRTSRTTEAEAGAAEWAGSTGASRRTLELDGAGAM